MAIVINFAGASIVRPGAYSRTLIASGGAASAQLGIVALIGESTSGPAFVTGDLAASTFGPDQFSTIVDTYGSGELVDMAKLVLSPSADPQISGGAQQLILVKTNGGNTAQVAIPTSYGTIKAASPGLDGNSIAAQVSISGGQATITVSDAESGVTEVSDPIGGNVDMTLLCTDSAATAATVTISATALTTTVTGGATSPLNISLSQFSSIANLVDYINTIPGYTATAPSAINAVQPPSVMDQVTAVSIHTTPASIVQDVTDVEAFFATSTLVTATITATGGLPTTMAKTYLSGGTLGGTSAAQIQNAIDALQSVNVNFIVPCFSQDATVDITTGFTDPSSTYTIAAIVAGLRSHVAQMSTVTGRKERQGFVGFRNTFVNDQTASATYNYPRIQMHIQEAQVLTAAGTVDWKQPHALAVCAAGMKAAAVVGLPNTFKQPNILGFRSPFGDFDPEMQGDEGIYSNLTFVEMAPGGGFRYVLDNSTYASTLDNWFYARPSVIYAGDVAAFSIRLNVETFVGQRNSDVSVESVKNLLVKVMDSLRASGIIVGDAASGGKGYTVLNVRIAGSIIYVDVTLVLVEGIEFVLNTITVQRASS